MHAVAAVPRDGHPPRVTVICIFFNEEQFIDEALASVMAQSYDDFELLLCDDGSTDDSTARALEWQARHPGRIRYLEHPGHVNQGMSATRNLGISAARGELIAFIDADDVWRPEKLAEQVAILDAHPELGLVCGTVRYWSSWAGGVDEVIPTGHMLDRVVPPPDAVVHLYPLGPAGGAGMDLLVRRDVVDSVGGFESDFTGMYEDQAFLLKVFLTWPVWFSSRLWLDYRQHAGSEVATVTRAGGYHRSRRYFLDWFESHLDSRSEPVPRSVRRVLDRALRPYRHPVLHAVSRFPRRAVGRALRLPPLRPFRWALLRVSGQR
ncbi:glycosyltransferase family 2 protein [Geodermatophilus sp. SYSU D00867]